MDFSELTQLKRTDSYRARRRRILRADPHTGRGNSRCYWKDAIFSAVRRAGTGKTAAFAIPILQRLAERPAGAEKRKISALVITPTRELALQIHESFTAYGRHLKLRCAVVFGGVSQKPQEDALAKGVDILIATPGRLWDLMGQKLVDISKIDVLVLDEADRMLDMGFIHDVRRIVKKTPDSRQTLMFSATMPPDIAELANEMLKEPHRIDIAPAGSTVDTIRSSYISSIGSTKRICLSTFSRKAPSRRCLYSREQSTVRTACSGFFQRTGSKPRRSTETNPRGRVRRRSRTSRITAFAFWSPPTLRRAESTSTSFRL